MKFFIGILLVVFAAYASAAEIISIVSPYTASHKGHTAIYKILEKANTLQQRYNFILELKPGGAGVLALKSMDRATATSIGLVHPSFVQNSIDGLIQEENYVPISSLGDACWFIVAKSGDEQEGLKSLANTNDRLVFGGVGVGSASHLTALGLGTAITKEVQFVPFQSAADAGILLVGNNEVNLNMMPMHEFEVLYTKNSSLKRLAIHCPRRHLDAKWVATTREQGIVSPYIFNTFVVNKKMPPDKQKDLGAILDQAMISVGSATILDISGFYPPVFDKVPVGKYHSERVMLLKEALARHQADINKFKKSN
jgi:tripartite-type tricarboxylate transporter receptor subunit TctC